MKHARKDYNRIQDPENKIPENEPVFLLRSQDLIAPLTVMRWAVTMKSLDPGCSVVRELADKAKKQAYDMLEWQAVHGTKIAD